MSVIRQVKQSLNFKITLSVIMVISFFGLAATFSVYYLSSSNLTSIQHRQISSASRLETDNLSQLFLYSQEIVRKLSQNPQVISYFLSPKIADESLTGELNNYNLGNRYSSIYLINLEGTVLVATDPTFVGNDYSFREYFTKAVKGESSMEFAVGMTTKLPGYYFSSPVKLGGKIIGVVVAKLDPSHIENIFLSRVDILSSEPNRIMVNQDGVVIYSSRDYQLYKSLGKLSTEKLKQISNLKSFPSAIVPLDYGSALKSIEEGKDHVFLDIYDAEDRENELLFVDRIGSTPFYHIFEVDKDSVTSQSFSLAAILCLFVFSAALTAAAIIAYVINRFLLPLRDLTQISQKISAGDYHQDLLVNTGDEIGLLSESINKMATNLINAKQNTERDIIAATEDLRKFQLAVENASDQIIITDREGMVVYANPVLEKITGYTLKETIATKAGRLWGGLMTKEYYRDMWHIIKDTKKVFVGEVNNRRKNGEDYIASLNISPILNSSGEVIFFVAIERDITKIKEIDKMKSEFITLASHQMRTPLSATKWFSDMLLKGDAGKLKPQQIEFVQNIYDSNERLVNLVNSLVNISRIDSGKLTINPRPTNIADLVNQVVTDHQSQILAKKLKIKVNIPDNLPELDIDPDLIHQVYQNLLSNAIKYTPEGNSVSVSLHLEGKNLVSDIADTGLGIPKPEQHRIFERFFRSSNAIKQVTDGNGLGLYLVKTIVDSSGGKIWFESIEKKGSTFSFSLPLKRSTTDTSVDIPKSPLAL